uniref:Stylicin 1 n=1 Tax=Penaeus paulensis TaxID=71413 RepID=A0A6B9P1P5_PENPU|nr:stylicin 1 [Penaeus paulensis]
MKTYSQVSVFVLLVAILHTSQGSSFSPAAIGPPGWKRPCVPQSCPPCPYDDDECPKCDGFPVCHEVCPDIHIACDCPFHHSCECPQPVCEPCERPIAELIKKGGYKG